MSEKRFNIIPPGLQLPYSLEDLSVVIPQASQYVRRIKWFIPQYIKMTPPQVIKNTLVVYDKDDLETKAVLDEYKIRGKVIEAPQSIYKQEEGFKEIKTRLCVRIHNDTVFVRNDWAQTVVDIFNSSPKPQLVGALNISGGIDKERLDKFLSWYPCFKPIYDDLIFSESEAPTVGAPFLSAFFMASQTYVWRGLYSLVLELNDGKMDKEDVVTTLLFSVFSVIITSWTNMYSFVKNANTLYGDFDEGFIPEEEQFFITPETKANFPKAEFKEVIYK